MVETTILQHRHTAACGCLAPIASALSRRGFLGMGAGVAGLACLGVPAAFAASGDYEMMLVSCIDPRLVSVVHEYMAAQNWRGQYSQFVMAGGPVGAVAPSFAKWRPAFWDNLQATIDLHNIKRVYGMTHRDCGAMKIAYGEAAVATPDAEEAIHRRVLAAFRAEVLKRHPKLGVDTGIMALDGSVEKIG
jgi:hypothetical protein